MRDLHRSGESRRVGKPELEAEAPAAVEDEQIQLGLAVDGPEVRLARLDDSEDLLQGEALPGGSHLRMAEQRAI